MKTFHKTILLILLFVFTGTFLANAETGAEKELKSAESLVKQERFKSAIAKLLKLAGSKGLSDNERGKAALLLAIAYRNAGQDDKALETLKGIAGSKPDEFYLELGEAQFIKKNYEEAIYASNCYDEKANCDNLLFVRAMWLKARVRFETEDYLDCMKSCRNITNFIFKRSVGDVSESDKEDQKKLDELKKNANELYEKARHLYDIKVYGEDYAWYRLGRIAEIAEKYEDAINCYGKIKEGVLKDAGVCYTGHCLAKMGKVKEALKTYSIFYESEPAGLYREEALYHQAVLIYQSGTGDRAVKDSLDLIIKLQDCLKVIAESQRKIELKGINDALKREVVDETPRMFLKPDDCGNLIRMEILPETISNRATAPWYLPCLETRAKLFHGFLLGESGNKAEAAMMYKKAMNSGKMKIISSSDTLPSLLEGLLEGFYLLPGECRKRFPQKHYNQMALACFYYVSEEKELARQMFKKLLSGEDIKPASYAADAVRLGLAYCCFSENKTDQAEKILTELLKNSKYKKYEIYRQTSYLYACLLAAKPLEKQKVYSIFEALAEKNEKGSDCLAPKALLALAVTAINNGDMKKADEASGTIRKNYAETPYADAARTLETAIQNSKNKEDKDKNLLSTVETKTGKVILHRRTLVIPSLTNFEPDTSQFTPGDFVVYRIKCVARDPCAIVKQVTHHLSENEPQIPSVNGNEIIFLRSPLLYIKNLQYDFPAKFPGLKDADKDKGSSDTDPLKKSNKIEGSPEKDG